MHFYTQTGEPRHFVEMKTRPGELRPTRTSDAKKEGWVPSVTTILNMLDKPALLNWKVDQHLIQAFNLNSLEGFSTVEQFIQYVKDKTQEQMDIAPQAGTDFHVLMEKSWRNEPLTDEEFKLCYPVYETIISNTGYLPAEPEVRFAHPLGFAGMTDLVMAAATEWVIDYKTKQTTDKFKPGKMAYPDHSRQLAAYRVGLGMPSARCANVFICLEDGQIDFHEHKEEDLQRGWETFKDCLNIWKRENYDSSFVLKPDEVWPLNEGIDCCEP